MNHVFVRRSAGQSSHRTEALPITIVERALKSYVGTLQARIDAIQPGEMTRPSVRELSSERNRAKRTLEKLVQ